MPAHLRRCGSRETSGGNTNDQTHVRASRAGRGDRAHRGRPRLRQPHARPQGAGSDGEAELPAALSGLCVRGLCVLRPERSQCRGARHPDTDAPARAGSAGQAGDHGARLQLRTDDRPRATPTCSGSRTTRRAGRSSRSRRTRSRSRASRRRPRCCAFSSSSGASGTISPGLSGWSSSQTSRCAATSRRPCSSSGASGRSTASSPSPRGRTAKPDREKWPLSSSRSEGSGIRSRTGRSSPASIGSRGRGAHPSSEGFLAATRVSRAGGRARRRRGPRARPRRPVRTRGRGRSG